MWSVRQDVLTRVVEALAVKLRAPSMYILETELNHILTFNIEHTSPHIPNTQYQRSTKHLYYPSQKYVKSPKGAQVTVMDHHFNCHTIIKIPIPTPLTT